MAATCENNFIMEYEQFSMLISKVCAKNESEVELLSGNLFSYKEIY
jgi:hypothetical protein